MGGLTRTIDTAIGLFRRNREANFRSTCRIERSLEGDDFDPGTGAITPADPEIVYEGACNVRELPSTGFDTSAGDAEVRLGRAKILLPHDTDVREGDFLVVTASTYDAELVDRRFRITDVFLDAWQTVREAAGEKLTGLGR